MAHLRPKPSSPYNFGLGSDFQIALILPFLYFFSAIFPELFAAIFPNIGRPTEVAPKPASLTENASPNTCGLTPPDELLASLDQRRNTIGEQAAISLIFILIIRSASQYYDFKWHASDWTSQYCNPLWMMWFMDHSFLRNKLFPKDSDPRPVPPPDDYRVTQRREAMRLLFLVVISALLCPVADYLCGRREGAFVFWFDAVEFRLSLIGAAIFVFGRCGMSWGVRLTMVLSRITLPCVATAVASVVLAYATFGWRYGVVDIWDRRVELWVEAWKKEKLKAENDEWNDMFKRFDLQKIMNLKEAQDEAEMGERNKELLVWCKGMKEGKGYGPDYWLPREKGATAVRQRSFKYSSVVDEDAYNPTASRVTHTSRECKGGLYA